MLTNCSNRQHHRKSQAAVRAGSSAFRGLVPILGLASYVQVRPLAIELGLMENSIMYHARKVGSSLHYGYSQAALDRMKQAIADGIDMKDVL